MNSITIHDRHFVPYLSSDEIQHRIRELALRMNDDLAGRKPLLLAILNGAFMFAADLMKSLTIPLEISFVKLASYQGTGTSGVVNKLIGLNEQIRGRCIVIVEDIIDTGITMQNLLKELTAYEPEEVCVAALLFKPDAFKGDFRIDYLGFSIPNDFIVGYGLDYNGFGRNYPDIYTIVR